MPSPVQPLGIAAIAAVLVMGAPPLPAAAGIAYDSVTKFISSDSPQPQPGTFDADFQTASTPLVQKGGLFGKISSAMQNVGAMYRNGLAERRYIGTTKERTDLVAQNTADITDCTARTITHLDLNAKTYSVISMDQPQTAHPSGPSHEAPGPAPTDDGTKMSIDVRTTALGPMTIESVPTNGYDMTMRVTTTKPTGESSTFNSSMKAYYSKYPEPHFSCASRNAMMPSRSAAMSAAQFDMIRQALNSKGNPRFSVTNSGPALPSGTMSMWDLMTMTGNGSNGASSGNGAFAVETERGNIRSIGDTDAIFSVPPDFKKVES